MTDDIIKRLREAIAAGPTPGPWMHLVGDRLIYTKLGDGCKGEAVARVDWISGPSYLATLSFIAAASPDNIAALLDRLDKAERENERLRSAINWACGYNEGAPHFGEQPEQDAPYAWRHELRRRAGMPWKVERREK